MPRVGDPDAHLLPRVLCELAYLYCIHYFSPNKTSRYLLSDLLGGCILMTYNIVYLVLDKIDSPDARPWRTTEG
uniref:Uncharacterized protein n=1 Tax=Oryza punctata TaxID=4537 RepID=A0A0E0MBM9_ORYPU